MAEQEQGQKTTYTRADDETHLLSGNNDRRKSRDRFEKERTETNDTASMKPSSQDVRPEDQTVTMGQLQEILQGFRYSGNST